MFAMVRLVFIEDGNVDGEGICENEIITFGFLIEGTEGDEGLEGMLIAESSVGRAETPFAGNRDGGEIRLVFDHTHAADGESLRLEGSSIWYETNEYLLALALGWGRVGLFGFGGGPGMIPMMQAECVEAQAWVSEDHPWMHWRRRRHCRDPLRSR